MKKEDKGPSNKSKGKMAALKELHGIASQMMGDDFSELQKVTVAAKDKKGLKKGLEKAKELISKKS
jgi:hypothetical protein